MKSLITRSAVGVLLVAVLCLQQSGCAQDNGKQQPTNSARPGKSPPIAADDLVARLQDVLARCDVTELADAISQVFRTPDTSDAVQYLAEEWRLSLNQSGDRWSCIQRPLVRAHIANALAQAHANNLGQNIDMTSVAAALRDGLDSSDWVIAHLSIMGLDAVATPADFPKLEALAKSDNEVKREDALRVLASQCSDEAQGILDDLATHPGFEKLPEIRKEMDFFRSARCKQAAQPTK